MRVLLVEDDPMIGEALHGSLRDAGHAADWVRDGRAAWAALQAHDYEVLLLDLGLPGEDGLDLLGRLRARGDAVPVVVITARDGLDSRVAGLDAGADDYLVKPFELAELLARIRAVARRRTGTGTPLLTNGRIWLDPATRRAGRVRPQGSRASGAGAENPDEGVLLSHREFALLHALLQRPGTLLSRRQLEERIYGWGEEVESNAVDFLLHALRRKLGADAVSNVRGAGWLVARDE